MRPLVLGAAICSLISALAAFAPEPPPKEVAVPHVPEASGLRPVCGVRAIPEGDSCIPLPAANQPFGPAQPGRSAPRAREDETTLLLPRHPDKPIEYSAYVLPLLADSPVRVLSDLTGPLDPLAFKPLDGQKRAPGERAGVDFAAAHDDKVFLATIIGDEGKTKVVFVGEDAGVTIATLHKTHAGTSFLVLYGHLSRPGPGIVAGSLVTLGDVIGFVGDTGSPGTNQLYLEIRQVREGALERLIPDNAEASKARLIDDALSVATDIRNALALK